MRIVVVANEVYPVYTAKVAKEGELRAIEVDAATIARWQEAARVFDEAQDEIHDAYEACDAAYLKGVSGR